METQELRVDDSFVRARGFSRAVIDTIIVTVLGEEAIPRRASLDFVEGISVLARIGVAIEELARAIARRSLLQSLTMRATVDGAGTETGLYEIPADGGGYRVWPCFAITSARSRYSSG